MPMATTRPRTQTWPRPCDCIWASRSSQRPRAFRGIIGGVTRLRSVLLAACSLLALACASEPADPSGAAGGATGGSGGGGNAPESCPAGPGRETESAKVQVDLVSGRIVDE